MTPYLGYNWNRNIILRPTNNAANPTNPTPFIFCICLTMSVPA